MASVATEELLSGIEQRSTTRVRDVAAMTLDRFARAGLVLQVRSSLLDEVVLFASDNAQVAPDEKRPVYRAADLDRLLRSRADRI